MLDLNGVAKAENEQQSAPGRPMLINVLCCFMILAASVGLVANLLGLRELPTPYRLKAAASNVAVVVSAVGLFQMRKWGYWLYLASYVLGIALFYVAPLKPYDTLQSNWLSIVWLVVFSGLVLPFWKRLK